MMGISGSELLLIGVLALLVIGPKDLPKALRTFGRAVGQLRRMAWEFQRQVDDMGRQMERAADDPPPQPKPVDPAGRAAPAETAPPPPSAKDAP